MIWPEPVVVWKTVFEQAWMSWADGSYGIGAALVDAGP